MTAPENPASAGKGELMQESLAGISDALELFTVAVTRRIEHNMKVGRMCR
jgi:hypothetical protein